MMWVLLALLPLAFWLGWWMGKAQGRREGWVERDREDAPAPTWRPHRH